MPQETQKGNRAINTAPIKWAQRSDCLFLTVDLHGVTSETVEFGQQELHFKGESEGKYFEANLHFFHPIDPEGCKWKTHPLGVEIFVKKKKDDTGKEKGKLSGFWPHLLKEKALEKINTVTIDWNHYVDSDEEDEKETGFRWSRWS